MFYAGTINLNRELRGIDRGADRRIARIANRIQVRADRQIRSGNLPDIAFAEEEFTSLVLDVMVASHLRALNLIQPAYALGRTEIDKALRKAPAHMRTALKQMYGSIARSVAEKPMSAVREALLTHALAVAKGETGKKGNIRTALKSAGISLENSPVLRTVVRTQGSVAFNAAGWIAGQQNDEVWGYQYVTAGDERVRKTHREFEPRGVGVRYPKWHEFWLRYAPPNGWNCRCGLRLLMRGESVARIRPFPGTPDVPPSFQFNPGVVFSPARF